jgi:decaprenylphospho-beta-D-erythro-pentofuranosid-2-ulose 2-reductase
MKKILIIGATSAIAEATARLFAARGDALCLIARNADHLRVVAADLSVRGAMRAETATLDVTDFNAHQAVLDAAERQLGGMDIVLIAHGTLSDQAQCQTSVDALRSEFDINAVSTLALLTLLANRLEAQKHGTLAVISSVASDRGRQSNYVYGSAKAAVTTFLGGLRQRLAKANVDVLTIKPGFVDTPMTAGIASKGALWAQPERIADGIVKAIDRRRNVVYLPWFWRWIMLVIRHIPEPLFKKIRL